MEYIPETKMSEIEIRAGLDDGTLAAWRRDGNGVLWFRSMPLMRGVPDRASIEAEGDEGEK